MGFPGSLVIKNPPANARDMGLIPGWGRSPREGNGSPLQYSCLGNPMDRGARRATVCGVARESDTTEGTEPSAAHSGVQTVGVSGSTNSKEDSCECRRHKRWGFDSWVGKIPWRKAWQPTLVFLPGKSHGQRSLAGYSPWGCKASDTMEQAMGWE